MKQSPEYRAKQQLIDEDNTRAKSIIDTNNRMKYRIRGIELELKKLVDDANKIQHKLDINEPHRLINEKLINDNKIENEKLIKQQEDNIIALNSGNLS